MPPGTKTRSYPAKSGRTRFTRQVMPRSSVTSSFTAQKSHDTFSPPSISLSRVTASKKPIQSSEVMPSKRMNAIFIRIAPYFRYCTIQA